MGFNPSQSASIAHKKGPMLVLAGPGSGKTLVITHRTKYLIEQCGINPSNILVITFTKAAAKEMKERFVKLCQGTVLPVSFGTFHAVFFSVLKYAYRFNASNILREEQRITFLRDIMENLELELDDEGEFISGITSEISMIKNDRIDLEHYYSVNCSEEIFRKIYTLYEQKLRKANLLDFDDMLVFCYELFKERKDILKAWQEKFQYILIDEFQDINQVQYEVIKLLAAPRNNLFIVGDDDQSIYRFRGAKPEIMLNFEKDFPNTKKVLLDTNYRSTKAIVQGSVRVIKNNQKRFDKEIKTYHEEGENIVVKTVATQDLESRELIAYILEYKKRGIHLSDMAVLFRTNTQPRQLVEKFMEFNIPFKMRDSLPNIYEHWIARNILSYIKITLGSRERKEFLQIMNRPKRYISRECLEDSEISLECLKEYYKDKQWMVERIEKLEYDLRLLRNMPPYAAINFIRNGIGYEEYLKEYADFRRIKLEELIEILNEIQEGAKSFQTFEEWFAHIEAYSKELKEQAKNQEKQVDSVSLATYHSSKGLEYKIVFLIDVNEGITPHRKALVEADLEEERRMFYVAMTRAKKMLFIYSIEERFGKKLDKSRFVGELLLDKEALTPGTVVSHQKYGRGIIQAVEKGKLIVHFEKPDKTLLLDMAYCMTNQILTVK